MADDYRKEADSDIGTDGSNNSASTPWMGAFERVMGDQADQYQTAKPRPKAKSHRSSAILSDTIDIAHLPSRSAAASPFKIPDAAASHAGQRARSGSLDTTSPSRPVINRTPSSLVGRRTRMTSSGARLVSVSQEAVSLPDMYFNHAPTLQPLQIQNLLEDRRVLLRLSSDLGRALIFMKRKRSGHDRECHSERVSYFWNSC